MPAKVSARVGGAVDGEPYFFLSCAPDERDLLAERFLADLGAELDRAGAAHPPAPPEGAELPPAERRAVSRAVGQCRALVALYSAAYFRSAECGREWTAFHQRLRRFRDETGVEAPALVPVVWAPLPVPLPLRVPRPEPPTWSPAPDGLRHLMEDGPGAAYREALRDTARRVRVAAERFRLPVEPGLDLDAVQGYFPGTGTLSPQPPPLPRMTGAGSVVPPPLWSSPPELRGPVRPPQSEGSGFGDRKREEPRRRRRTGPIHTPAPPTGHRIVVIGARPGAGAATTTIALGSTLADHRQDRILAIDADPAGGTLGRRVRRETRATVRDMALAFPHLNTYRDARRFTSRNRQGLEVLAGEVHTAAFGGLASSGYAQLTESLLPHYPVVLATAGAEPQYLARFQLVDVADQLVIVLRPTPGDASAVDAWLDRLMEGGHADPATRAVVVIAGVRDNHGTIDLNGMVAHFQTRCRGVRVVPFDEHLAEGGVFDLALLRRGTREAYVDLAALVAADFGRERRRPGGEARPAPGYLVEDESIWSEDVSAREGSAAGLPGPLPPRDYGHVGSPQGGWAGGPAGSRPGDRSPGYRDRKPRRDPAGPRTPEPGSWATGPVGPDGPRRWYEERPAPQQPQQGAVAADGTPEQYGLVAELAEQTAPGREVPLHVQVVAGAVRGAPLRAFSVPPEGARLLITLHAPGLTARGGLQQELTVHPGRDSDVLRFGLVAALPGLHQVTVRAFRGGTFLGEVRCQISVAHDSPTRDGEKTFAALPSVAFDQGEVTLQVLKDELSGTFSFQLISETVYPPETFHYRAGDPRRATEQIYAELRQAARAAAGGASGDRLGEAARLRNRLRNHGVQLWTSAVPLAVQAQFWEQADRITAFTVLGEQDVVPWELLYPLNENQQDGGFLAEWLPVVRRVFGQDRVRDLRLPGAAFVVPPGSPAGTDEEVRSLRARFGPPAVDGGVLTERAALTALIERGHAGLLHFACHNAFTGDGSCVAMADGPFDPVDLASAAQLRSLRRDHPLVFFNACRSAGEIDWFGASLGWAPQFLRAGAGAFVGTLWPVRSHSALRFAEAFYDRLITDGQPLGQASLAARRAVRDQDGDPTWLAYAVYGSPAARATSGISP